MGTQILTARKSTYMNTGTPNHQPSNYKCIQDLGETTFRSHISHNIILIMIKCYSTQSYILTQQPQKLW